ncbi:hypothetical protein PV516_18865 [Streptomyces scabiei]|uniref:hypothetical protein n=1 Tax=Streptomyces scabiei TaxID=1930 RepID=UPI00299FA90F|nr:hypothetical protein [Streptomyces scabiei]MDX3165849.1 hypothetical protein [Streptomyces scabiei]
MPASKAQRAATAKRRSQAIALRLAGMDYQTIAERLDYADRGAASKDVHRALEANLEAESAAAATLRELEVQRLDRMQAAAWAKAAKGDLKAIETVLKVIDRRARLLGLDRPIRTEITGADGGPLQVEAVDLAELERLITLTDDTAPGGELQEEA